MASPTIDEITEAISTTIATAVGWNGLPTATTRDEDMTEDIVTEPLIQVYWEKLLADKRTNTSMSTFGTGMQDVGHLFHVDVYARQRSMIGMDMAAMRIMVDAILTLLWTGQKLAPFFGVDGIQAYRFRADRVTFAYGNPEFNYAGVRFQIEVDVFMT